MHQAGHPHLTGDIQNVHDLQLTYGTYASKGRRTECSRFTADIEGTSALRKMVRTPRTDKAQTETT